MYLKSFKKSCMVVCLFFITFTRSYSLAYDSAFFRSSSPNSVENIEADNSTSRACWTSSFFGGTTGSPSTGSSSSPLFSITFSSDLKVASISSSVEGIACDTDTSASTSIKVSVFNLFGTTTPHKNIETNSRFTRKIDISSHMESLNFQSGNDETA